MLAGKGKKKKSGRDSPDVFTGKKPGISNKRVKHLDTPKDKALHGAPVPYTRKGETTPYRWRFGSSRCLFLTIEKAKPP